MTREESLTKNCGTCLSWRQTDEKLPNKWVSEKYGRCCRDEISTTDKTTCDNWSGDMGDDVVKRGGDESVDAKKSNECDWRHDRNWRHKTAFNADRDDVSRWPRMSDLMNTMMYTAHHAYNQKSEWHRKYWDSHIEWQCLMHKNYFKDVSKDLSSDMSLSNDSALPSKNAGMIAGISCRRNEGEN